MTTAMINLVTLRLAEWDRLWLGPSAASIAQSIRMVVVLNAAINVTGMT